MVLLLYLEKLTAHHESTVRDCLSSPKPKLDEFWNGPGSVTAGRETFTTHRIDWQCASLRVWQTVEVKVNHY